MSRYQQTRAYNTFYEGYYIKRLNIIHRVHETIFARGAALLAPFNFQDVI